MEKTEIELNKEGNSLAIQWLGLHAFTDWIPRVRALVRELRSCKPWGTAQKKKKKIEQGRTP